MAPASSLSIAEIRIMKRMLAYPFNLSAQAVLAYFSRPGRDLNQRVVWQVRNGLLRPEIPPASLQEALAYAWSALGRQMLPAELYTEGNLNPRSLMMNARLDIDWWPAGQGLFASGSLTLVTGRRFTWVYDCGTNNTLSIIDGSIERFEERFGDNKRLDLMVLSHFDNDHLRGIVRLLQRFRVERFLLPYMPRWHRLMIAIASGLTADDAEFQFYLDPVTYLNQVSGAGIGEFVIVGPSGPDDVPEPPEDFPRDPEAPSSEPGSLEIDYGAPPSDFDDAMARAKGTARVRYLRPAGRLTLPGLWEFVPYNDGHLAARVAPNLVARIERLRSVLMHRSERRDQAMKRLKFIYESIFRTSKHRNQISLFLYSGPIGSKQYASFIEGHGDRFAETLTISQMHTGDGYLTDGPRFDAFEAFFRPGGRIDRSAFLQVMHHGAEGNWHDGIASKLNPTWSIFSSSPHQFDQHPDAAVLRDFWTFRPVQVDATKGFHVTSFW